MNEIFTGKRDVLRQCIAVMNNDKFLLLWQSDGTLA